MELEKFTPLFEVPVFTEEEKALISPFFTNVDKPVYSVTFLPAEIVGALCSMASRAKGDLRKLYLNQYVKPFLDDGGDYSNSLKALIEFLTKYPADSLFANPKAREFYVKWLAQFGDDSIAQMAGTHVLYSGISQIAIKQIEDQRIGIAPIEQSTRYIDYSTKINGSYRYYTDPTLADVGLEEEYKVAMDGLFLTYTDLMAHFKEFLKAKYPNEEERVINTKAFDVLRGLLPLSTISQVAFFANGQAFEYMMNRCLDHELGEIRWAAEAAKQELNVVIPAFLRRVDEDSAKKYRDYKIDVNKRVKEAMQEIGWRDQKEAHLIAPLSTVGLLSFDGHGEEKIIAGLLYQNSHQSFSRILGQVIDMTPNEKEKILKKALEGRLYKYYKVPRAFELAKVTFEIVMNIGAWRDLHRHRMHTQIRQLFSIHNGFDIPDELKEAKLDGKFAEAIKKAEEVFLKVEKVSPVLAQYCTVMAHRVRFLQDQNMRSFFWEAELRTINQGHPDYRKIEHDKIWLVEGIYPMLSKYLLVDKDHYEFARRGDSEAIKRKEAELSQYFSKK